MPEPETPQNCPHCGARLEPDESFCPDCGAKIGRGVEVQQKPTQQMAALSPEALQKAVAQLKDYVAECQAKGVPEDVAKAELIRGGWPKEIVNAVVPVTQKKETIEPSEGQPLEVPMKVPYITEDPVEPLITQLETHVKHLRKQGMSDDTIRERLLKDKCPQVLVDNLGFKLSILPPKGPAFLGVPAHPPTKRDSDKLSKRLWGWFLLFGGLAFLIGTLGSPYGAVIGATMIIIGLYYTWPIWVILLIVLVVVLYLAQAIFGLWFLSALSSAFS